MNYSERESSCRVDVFKPTGKWYLTEAYLEKHYDDLNGVEKSVKEHFQNRCKGMIAIVTEPASRWTFPRLINL